LISARISTRSFASRFDSGSSNRNSDGSRERAAHRDALPLAAGQLARLAVEQMLDLQHRRHALDDLLLLALRHLADVQAERDVLAHRHRRIQRVRLEHHRDVAILRRQVVDDLAVDADLAARHRLEAGDHVEQRRLPQPDPPTRIRNCPSSISMSTPFRTGTPFG
jgi:hypothetical protein